MSMMMMVIGVEAPAGAADGWTKSTMTTDTMHTPSVYLTLVLGLVVVGLLWLLKFRKFDPFWILSFHRRAPLAGSGVAVTNLPGVPVVTTQIDKNSTMLYTHTHTHTHWPPILMYSLATLRTCRQTLLRG